MSKLINLAIGAGIGVTLLSAGAFLIPGISNSMSNKRQEYRYLGYMGDEWVSFRPGARYGVLTVTKPSGEKAIYQEKVSSKGASLHMVEIISKMTTNIYDSESTYMGRAIFRTAEKKYQTYKESILDSNRLEALRILK